MGHACILLQVQRRGGRAAGAAPAAVRPRAGAPGAPGTSGAAPSGAPAAPAERQQEGEVSASPFVARPTSAPAVLRIPEVAIYTGQADKVSRLQERGLEQSHCVDLSQALRAQPENWLVQNCCGESGWVLESTTNHAGITAVVEKAVTILVRQHAQHRAVLGFYCRSGKHRSVALAEVFRHVLVNSGFPRVDLIHTSDYMEWDHGCSCKHYGSFGFCGALLQRCGKSHTRRVHEDPMGTALQLTREGDDKRSDVLMTSMGKLREEFARQGYPLV